MWSLANALKDDTELLFDTGPGARVRPTAFKYSPQESSSGILNRKSPSASLSEADGGFELERREGEEGIQDERAIGSKVNRV